jgi:hypothetical protein
VKLRRRPRALAASAAFTIVEVVLALGILALGASVLLWLLSFGASLATSASLRADAASVLPAIVADLEERLFTLAPDGAVGEPRSIVDQPVPGHPRLTYSATASPLVEFDATVDPLPPIHEVSIDLTWTRSGRRRTVTFETLLAQQVPFGARLRRRIVEGEAEQAAPAAERRGPTDQRP